MSFMDASQKVTTEEHRMQVTMSIFGLTELTLTPMLMSIETAASMNSTKSESMHTLLPVIPNAASPKSANET